MVIVLAELLLVALVVALLAAVAWGGWVAFRSLSGAPGPVALPARRRAELAAAIARAQWVPGHDEVDGVTRVLVRRTYVGLDGRPEVLDERVLETFPAQDPAWDALHRGHVARPVPLRLPERGGVVVGPCAEPERPRTAGWGP